MSKAIKHKNTKEFAKIQKAVKLVISEYGETLKKLASND